MAGVASTRLLESVPTEFDYFESKSIQAAVVNEFDRCFYPPSLQHGAPIEFEVKGAGNLYLDLNNSKLEIKCKITNLDGTDIANDTAIGPVNLTLHSLFSSIEMDICGRTITNQNTLYQYRALMETILSYDESLGKTRLQAEGWLKDTPGHYDDFRIDGNGANNGFQRRVVQFARSRIVTLIGRPHLDLFHQNLNIPPGCNIRLRLFPSNSDFVLKRLAANHDHYRMQIMSARLWIRTKDVSPSFLLAHETMLQRQNIRIPFTKVEMKTVTIQGGLTSIELDNLYTGVLPERVCFLMLDDNRLNGDANHNPFLFNHFDLTHVSMLVNGEQLPRVAYQPNFQTGDYLREYFGLLEGLGLDTGNKTIDITPEIWATTFPFFIFRLTPGGLPSVPKSGSVRLDMKFRNPTPRNVIIILYTEVPTVLEIDKDRNATIA